MTSSKPKAATGYDDDPWRVLSTPPHNDFPTYQDVPIKRSIAPKTMIEQPAVVDRNVDKVSTQALVKASTESYQWFLDLDQINVAVAEKEGFLFTHVNYWVHSTQRQTSVRRRYSDFYWFWEVLSKRYPFRVVPNLPPKKMSGSEFLHTNDRKYG